MDKQQYTDAGRNSPLATADQDAVERIALKLHAIPAVQAIIADTARELKGLIPHGPISATLFDYEFEQMYWASLLSAGNADPSHPRIHAVNLFPHQIDGTEVLGTRALHPSPDYIYRLAPVDDSARFVIHGKKPPNGPVTFEMSLIGGSSSTQGNLSLSGLTIAPDGSFTVSIDTEAAGGRPNHLQTSPGSQQLIIRDIFDNIAQQRPMTLTIERLDPPKRPPMTIDDFVQEVPRQMKKGIVNTMALTAAMNRMPPNVLPAPAFMNQTEALVTQAYAIGHFKLTSEQAFVITMTMGDAGYAVVPATNYWGGIGDFMQHRCCISSPRATPNSDGSYTYVIALADPGVANWIDTDGLDEGMLCVRWTAFKPNGGPMPTLTAQLVDRADLESALPPGTPRLDANGRREQMEQHLRDYGAWGRG